MQINAARMYKSLRDGALQSIYLLHGEEPLQKAELLDGLRARARDEGFTDREVLDAERGFDWGSLAQAADSLSLFAERRIIELRLGAPRLGRDGPAAIAAYAERPPPDTLLLVSADRLEFKDLKSAWFRALDSAGVVVACQPLVGDELQAWVETRMRRAGLEPSDGAVELICARVEGNLLAADQEIQKLALLCGSGPVEEMQVLAAVADSARFNPYDLSAAALAGDAERCARVLEGLREEGVGLPLLHWVLRNEVRALFLIGQRQSRGDSLGQAFSSLRIPKLRQMPLRQALQRLRPAMVTALMVHMARLERVLKGMDGSLGTTQDTQWQLLLELTLRLAGARLPRRLSF